MKAVDFAVIFVALALLSFGCFIVLPVAIISFSDPQPYENFCPDEHPPECVSTPDYCFGRTGSYLCTQVKHLFLGITVLCLFIAIILAIIGYPSKEKAKSGSRHP